MVTGNVSDTQRNFGFYRRDVDGLRALAVLAVVLFHYDFTFLSGGFIGVDIFFVISGFVITKSIYHDLENKRFSIQSFYFKRIRRIMPALFVIYILSALAAAFILLPSDLVSFGKSLLASSTFVSNIYFWKASGYFAAAAATQPLLHTWSLSVEEQYYVFAPVFFLITFAYGIRNRNVLAILVLGAILSFIAAVAAVFLAPTAGFFLLPTRLWELLIGAIVALTPAIHHGTLSHPIRQGASYLGIALIVIGLVTIHESDPFPGWNALFPVIGTALMMIGGSGREQPLFNRFFATRIPVGIGLISYSLYLVHWPLIAFLRYRINRDLLTYEAIGLVATSILLAYLSWRFVEQPFRHLQYKVAPQLFASAAVAILLIVSIGGSLWSLSGLPQRFPDFVEQKIKGVEAWGGNACFHQNASKLESWDPETCKRISGEGGNILIWGDSFAAHYMPGILANSARLDANVYQYTFAGCPPILAYFSLARRACSEFNHDALKVMDERKIDMVVLSARWSDVPSGTLSKLNETIAAIQAKGIQVAVIGPSPQFPAEVQRLDYVTGRSKLTGDVATQMVSSARVHDVVAEQAAKATFIDPLHYLCKDEMCNYRKNQEYLYADYGHFSGYGAALAVGRYFPTSASIKR